MEKISSCTPATKCRICGILRQGTLLRERPALCRSPHTPIVVRGLGRDLGSTGTHMHNIMVKTETHTRNKLKKDFWAS